MRHDAQVRARVSAAQQHETALRVLWKNATGFGLVHLAFEHLAGTGRTPTLQAAKRHVEAGFDSCVEEISVILDGNSPLLAVGNESDLVGCHVVVPNRRR